MSRHRFATAVAVTATVCATIAGCGSELVAEPGPPAAELRVEVVATHPHDPEAFTQGLEIDEGELLEGTGRTGRSWVAARPVDISDGGIALAAAERTRVPLGDDLFGEGITVVGDEVWQLTWKDGTAVVRDRHTLSERRRVDYDGEGWGLCAQPERLVMSDGTADLIFRDAATFDELGRITVHREGRAVAKLNELECTADGSVYANVWQTDEIVRIDPSTGRVEARIDAAPLRDLLPEGADVDVLNGIAHIPGTDRFLVTGKYWPTLFEVRFVP
ncbi:glutaminyl-peptide cyclotransferase [Rhodococcus sp. NPDC047139]|uniref:glutaminyl-peptide cyclotransferase n=1 Tax=Rhodococcus sp. NPDC047139 TaxID=3155141 RepID=UPI0033CF12C7